MKHTEVRHASAYCFRKYFPGKTHSVWNPGLKSSPTNEDDSNNSSNRIVTIFSTFDDDTDADTTSNLIHRNQNYSNNNRDFDKLLLLMTEVLHYRYLKDPKLWDLWYTPSG